MTLEQYAADNSARKRPCLADRFGGAVLNAVFAALEVTTTARWAKSKV